MPLLFVVSLIENKFCKPKYRGRGRFEKVNLFGIPDANNEKIFCYLFFDTMRGIILTIDRKSGSIYFVYICPKGEFCAFYGNFR